MNKNSFFSKIFTKGNEEEEPPLSELFKKYGNKIAEYDKKMIINIIQLSNISVKEVMVPRVDVVSIDTNSDIKDIIKIVAEKGHSRLPVYENNNIDNIIGILHSKDLLKYFTKESDFNISKIVREPLFVPESKMINDLLIELREKRNHLALVVDEYGGMSGIICLEDIIEKIVGDIQDEFDNEADEIQRLDENTYLINPRISLEDLNERLNTNFNEEEIDTLGGIIFMALGKIPTKNETINYNGYKFTIESISGRKIKKVKMEILDGNNEKDKDNGKN